MSSPSTQTIKRLFALSSNCCAYSNCKVPVIDNGSGAVIGEICHIAGKKPGAPRFDPNQNDDERHSFGNLILMCPTHHKLVDELEAEYSTQRLHEMKLVHESSAITQVELPDELIDDLFKASASKAQSLNNMARVLNWGDLECKDALPDINSLLPILMTLPRRSREFFVAILRRSKAQFFGMTVLWPEIQHALRLDDRSMRAEVAILEDHGLVTVDIDDRDLPIITVRQGHSDWLIWDGIRDYCQKSGISLTDVIVNLNFDYFD